MSAAIAVAQPRQTIVARGTFQAIDTTRDLILRGACDGSLVIGGGPDAQSIRVSGGRLLVAGAELRGAVSVTAGAHLELRGVHAQSGDITLSAVAGATVIGSELSVQGRTEVSGHLIASDSDWSSAAGATVVVRAGGTLDLEASRCSAESGSALLVEGSTSELMLRKVVLEGALVVARGADAQVEDLYGARVRGEDGARLRAQRLTLSGPGAGIQAQGAAVELSDVVLVASGIADPLMVVDSATVSIARLLALGFSGPLLVARTSSIALEDAVLAAGPEALTTAVLSGGVARLSRIKATLAEGLRCDDGARVLLEDVNLDARHQRVLGVQKCQLSGRRLLLRGYVRAQSPSGSVDLEDALLDEAGSELGALFEGGATARLARVRVDSTTQEGIRVKGPSSVVANDVDVTAHGGFGVLVSSDGTWQGARLAVAGADVCVQSNRSAFQGRQMLLSGCHTGISVTEGQRALWVDGVVARGAQGAGVSIGGWGPSYHLASVDAVDNGVGVELSSAVPRATVSEQTRLYGNVVPIVVCASWPCVRP